MRAWAGVALLSFGLSGSVRAAFDPATLIKLSSSVLKVEVNRAQGGYSLGSGVVVGEDEVVTSCHVTRDAEQVSVLQDGLRLPAQSQRVDVDHDLCLLRVPGIDSGRAVKLGQARQLVIGQPLTAIGHTAGALQSSGGEVVALHRMDGSQIIQASNYFSSGASGGGLFDAQLRLVGILTFRLRGGLKHYFAVPTDWLKHDLGDPAEPEQTIGPLAPALIAFWQRPAEAQPFFLRAAVFENNGNWRALQPLATDWLQHDPTDPEPWYLLGLARSRQDEPHEARHVLSCALALAPDFERARTELEHIAQAPGGPDAAVAVDTATCHL